jgi:hypothetical protein
MRRLIALVPTAAWLLLPACGGGGNDSPLPVTGGGSGGATANVAPLTVDAGPAQNSVNTAYLTVTVCSPGSSTNCQTIDHIEVDTQSYGLRILSAALPPSFTLPQEADASGSPIVECTVFADGVTWGPVKTADVHIAGETAGAVPMQIIGDASFSAVPADCSSRGTPEDTIAKFGANGILGVGPFIEDAGTYYTCPQGTCTQAQTAAALQVSNPVAFFAADNNGVIVQLPQVPTDGAAALTGALVFGIGTQSNNGLGNAAVYALDPNSGTISITYKNTTFPNSFIDSGSNAIYFVDSSIPKCTSGFYCPASTLSLAATITGTNAASATVDFSVGNADSLFSTNGVAFGDLAAPNPDATSFDFGLPFYFGRSVYTAIDNQNTPGGIGPYVAF